MQNQKYIAAIQFRGQEHESGIRFETQIAIIESMFNDQISINNLITHCKTTVLKPILNGLQIDGHDDIGIVEPSVVYNMMLEVRLQNGNLQWRTLDIEKAPFIDEEADIYLTRDLVEYVDRWVLNNVPSFSAIVAVDEDLGIGFNGDIPWKLSNDMKFFKDTTMGKVCIMGRKTYESIPEKFRPLPGRLTIVVTNDLVWAENGVLAVNCIDDAVELATTMAKSCGLKEIMVCGGGQIYEAMLPFCKKIYMTQVFTIPDIKTDTFFPLLEKSDWIVSTGETFLADDKNSHPHIFETYERKHGYL